MQNISDLKISDVCKSEFSDNESMIYHCNLCFKSFTKATTFSKHMKTGHSLSIFACRKCTAMYSELGHLFLHSRKLHSTKEYVQKKWQCYMCPYSTDNGGLHKHHLRAHFGKKPEICDICTKGFTQHSNMKVHRKRHFKPQIEFYCDECDTSYGSHDILLSHIGSKEHKLVLFMNRTFVGKVVFVCQVCNTLSDNIEEFVNHGANCMCSNRIVCQLCSERLPLDRSKLREHRKNHRNEVIMCWECGETSEHFASKTLLIVHLLKEHGIDLHKSFVCRYCERIFENKDELMSHIDVDHSEIKYKHHTNQETGRLECRVFNCDFVTNSFLQLEKHEKSAHKDLDNVKLEQLETIEPETMLIPFSTVKTNQRGRPRLCNTNFLETIVTGENLTLDAVVSKKRGRPRHEFKEIVEKIPKKRGRPKKVAE